MKISTVQKAGHAIVVFELESYEEIAYFMSRFDTDITNDPDSYPNLFSSPATVTLTKSKIDAINDIESDNLYDELESSDV